ncbi:MAG: hypothetical protein ACRC62_03040 [Microcoleus sp.]
MKKWSMPHPGIEPGLAPAGVGSYLAALFFFWALRQRCSALLT